MADMAAEPRVVREAELELLGLKVADDGGAVRYLEGARYGIGTSIFRSTIVPGSGPLAHSHPYAEIFVVEAGRGTYMIDDVTVEAGEGDIVIVPRDRVHSFRSTGDAPLRHVAIHEHPSFVQVLATDPAAREGG